mmetsp:Transcript_17672/g.27668  ORF Transcript_17672/g.27668 Transcript_17672/m.27668 type:complete len:80 (-) Transcript_17672:116-355(-)
MCRQFGKGSCKILGENGNALGHLIDNIKVPKCVAKAVDRQHCHTYFTHPAIVSGRLLVNFSLPNPPLARKPGKKTMRIC